MTRRSLKSLFAPTAHRPVMTQDQIMDLCAQVLNMSSVDFASVEVQHTARSVVQLAHGKVESVEDGDRLNISFQLSYNHAFEGFVTDESEPSVLKAMVQRCEKIMLDRLGTDQKVENTRTFQDTYVPAHLWYDSTVDAMQNTRATLVPQVVNPLVKEGLVPSGFFGFIARAKGVKTKNPTEAYYEETDCEVSVTARTADDAASGWAGQANRQWEKINPDAITAQAADIAKRSVNAKAFEPGKRTVIMTPEAAAQIMRYFAYFYDSFATEHDEATPFWRRAYPPNKVGLKVFDSQITMTSDPSDPEGGAPPYYWDAYANPKMVWADKGILKALCHYQPGDAVGRGLPYSDYPAALRISGGSTSIDEMVARCQEGIYVNHFSSVELNPSVEGRRAGLMTGTTRDGCFLVKDGKIDIPLKNFRFIDSPMFMLNNIIALGEPRRAAYGYTPVRPYEPVDYNWPRRPIVLPPMMVRDFNFTSLADAV